MSDRPSLPADALDIRDEQVARALRRLDDHGELTPRQRATVERLADRLVTDLLLMFDAERTAVENVDAGDRDSGTVLFSG